MEAAAEWGMPPWEVEEKCTEKWWHWWTYVRGQRVRKYKRDLGG